MENTDLELFDGYIADSLSLEDKSAFEQRLETDASLKKRFEEYKVIVGGIKISRANALKQKLVRQESKYVSTPSIKPVLYKIAATLIFVVAATFIVNQFTSEKSYEELYQEYYSPYPNIIDPVSRSEKNNSSSLFQLYEEQKYTEVINALEDKERTEEERFYLSQTYMAVGQFNKALLEAHNISTNSRFYAPSQWYIALIHLNIQDTTALTKQLDFIITAKGDYKKRALDLKENL